MGSDNISPCDIRCIVNFNPRSPHGERPGGLTPAPCPIVISIHAPRMGSDKTPSCFRMSSGHFNPRSPHGERPERRHGRIRLRIFQSTLPAWGATRDAGSTCHVHHISIHAPRMGSDPTPETDRHSMTYFNPRSPHGERPMLQDGFTTDTPISIHAPRMGSDALSNRR